MIRRHRLRAFQSLAQRRHACDRLQRVLGRDQPPNLIERQLLQREQAEAQMALMRGVERATQQTDGLGADAARLRLVFQGRTCPVPWTRYL